MPPSQLASAQDVVVQGLVKRFGNVAAVNDVSFTVRKGSFFSLLGPSGCGKTTTLRALAGFVEPDEGTITIGGQVMNWVPPNLRPTNMVFQQLALFPHLNVEDNIKFGMRMHKTPAEEMNRRVKDVLALVDMSGYEKRRGRNTGRPARSGRRWPPPERPRRSARRSRRRY